MVGGLLDHGVAGLGRNTTLVVMVTSHHDVALEAPASTPAVCVCEWVWWGREGEKWHWTQKRVWSELTCDTQHKRGCGQSLTCSWQASSPCHHTLHSRPQALHDPSSSLSRKWRCTHHQNRTERWDMRFKGQPSMQRRLKALSFTNYKI